MAACLVQSAYVLEHDRQEKRQGDGALAPPWWEFFHFRPILKLVDDVDTSIFGAVFEFKPPVAGQTSDPTAANAPKFIVAFRGTITKKESLHRDLMLDLRIIENCLHRTSRCRIALEAIQNAVSMAGSPASVWLAGHSLGSAIAAIAGRSMAKAGVLLGTFLFNPPFFAVPIEKIRDENIKDRIRIASSLITAGVNVALKGRPRKTKGDDSFAVLSPWVPCLFVHPSDYICSEYIGYFQHRRKMEEMGAGAIERLATHNPIGGLILGALGKESDPFHLLPSAVLNVNLSPCREFMKAHALHQWWELDLKLQTTYNMYQ